jgi:hypothetical protein
MQEKENRLSKFVIMIFIIMFLGIFIFSFWLLFSVMNSPIMPNWFFGPIGLLVILIFDVTWVLTMKSLFKEHIKLKIFLIFLGITLSTSVLAWWLIDKTPFLDHMFG